MVVLSVSLRNSGHCQLVVPLGLATPQVSPISVKVAGADMRLVADPQNGQHLACLSPNASRIKIIWTFGLEGCAYPEAMFAPRISRFTSGAADMVAAVTQVAAQIKDPQDRLAAVVAYVTDLFTYGHAEVPFYDGHDAIPELCGLTVGSCVDINAYLIAACRSVGIEAGYMTGYFIPEEKRSHTTDMHCWVVTRAGGVVQEWDIAHHLKMQTRKIRPGLNPKPGVRVPMAHSMGWNIPALGVQDAKLMAEPIWLLSDGSWRKAEELEIKLEGYDRLAAG